ncbi:MAG: DNA-processing protein DprA [Elusimicrobia bacterium]|nr:DNA-processing protein DprA [Elusimicrobiota bacterium]
MSGEPAAARLDLLRRNAVSALGPERGRDFDALGEWRRAREMGVSLLFRDEPGYPQLLRPLADAPLALYVRGRLESGRDALAFVGSRQPSPYGRRMTRRLVREASARFVIVSGLARGIDTEAHRAALEAGGTTWAVLGSGLGCVYPPENADLAREIVAGGGGVLSEFPLDAEPLPGHFPRRNRIVAGLCWGTVVVEGRDKSGALITARLAAQQGREVFAVPGPADSPLSEAPLRLISQGAKMVRSGADIWPELPPGCRTAAPPAELPMPPARDGLLAPAHEKILQLLGSETRSVAELGAESGLDISSLTQTLFELELRDLVEAVPGQRYAKKSS